MPVFVSISIICIRIANEQKCTERGRLGKNKARMSIHDSMSSERFSRTSKRLQGH